MRRRNSELFSKSGDDYGERPNSLTNMYRIQNYRSSLHSLRDDETFQNKPYDFYEKFQRQSNQILFQLQQQREWREEQNRNSMFFQIEQRRREEEHRRTIRYLDNADIRMDISKGMMRGHSAGLHPIARLELLQMGIRP